MTLMEELKAKGFMKVSNAISLYDNLLVGRKRSSTPKGTKVPPDSLIKASPLGPDDDDFQEKNNMRRLPD